MARRTSCPRACRALGRAPTTSARPPTLTKGTISAARIKILSGLSHCILPTWSSRFHNLSPHYTSFRAQKESAAGRGLVRLLTLRIPASLATLQRALSRSFSCPSSFSLPFSPRLHLIAITHQEVELKSSEK